MAASTLSSNFNEASSHEPMHYAHHPNMMSTHAVIRSSAQDASSCKAFTATAGRAQNLRQDYNWHLVYSFFWWRAQAEKLTWRLVRGPSWSFTHNGQHLPSHEPYALFFPHSRSGTCHKALWGKLMVQQAWPPGPNRLQLVGCLSLSAQLVFPHKNVPIY